MNWACCRDKVARRILSYGKRQSSWVPMVGGVLIAASYFAGSALLMSLICAVLVAAIYVLLKRGLLTGLFVS